MSDRGPVAAGGTRVLLEAPDGPEGAMLWRALNEHGYEVSWCPGPEGPPATWCPLMNDRPCDFVDCADVVVSALGFGSRTCREVLAKLGKVHPRARVIAEAPLPAAVQWGPVLDGYRVLITPVSERRLLDAIERPRNDFIDTSEA